MQKIEAFADQAELDWMTRKVLGGSTFVKWFMLGVFAMLCRVGEASNPEPAMNLRLDAYWVIATFPTNYRSPTLQLGPLAKPTYIAAPGKAQQPNMQVQLGADVAPNSETVSAIGGTQSGVSFLSNLPCRSMTHTWEDDQWKGCRIHASCFQMGAIGMKHASHVLCKKEPSKLQGSSRDAGTSRPSCFAQSPNLWVWWGLCGWTSHCSFDSEEQTTGGRTNSLESIWCMWWAKTTEFRELATTEKQALFTLVDENLCFIDGVMSPDDVHHHPAILEVIDFFRSNR